MKINFIGDKLFLFVAFVLLWGNIFAEVFSVSGYVYDAETNKPVANAVVFMLDTEKYTTTDNKGYFFFNIIPNGNIKLKTMHISYKEKIIDYDFVKNNKSGIVIYLVPNTIETPTVIINDNKINNFFDEIYDISGVLKGKELEKDLGLTLAATLKNETGISIRTMGPAPARPVIRGLGGDRVFISENGIKLNDLSATSPDHAVGVEAFTIDKIKVIRGPKVLTLTPTTFGGVVDVERNEITEVLHNKIYSTAGFFAETANKGYLAAFTSEIPFNPFSIYLETSTRDAGNIYTPKGYLKNSMSDNYNLAFGISYINGNIITGFSARKYSLNYGIPGGFIGAHPFGVNIELRRKQFNYKFIYNLNDKNKIDVDFSYSAYGHLEYEHNGLAGAEFKVADYIGKIEYKYENLFGINNGQLGISTDNRNFNVGGYVFTSPAKLTNIAVYNYQNFNVGNVAIEVAGRYNYDYINPKYLNSLTSIGVIKAKEFNTFSLSASVLYPLSKIVYIGGNINKSSRVPTIEELYSRGPHLAAYSYEVGNPELQGESGLGTEIFIYHKFEDLYFNISFFRNYSSYYIIPRNTGEINYATFLPVYESQGIKALFYGYELQADININEDLSIKISSSYTVGKNKSDNIYLPQIPPLKGNVEFKYSIDNLNLFVSCEYALAQRNIDLFETETAGYAIFNSSVQYSFEFLDQMNNVSLSAENLLNKEYRNHLSRVKSIMPETGRNFRLTYKIYFHL